MKSIVSSMMVGLLIGLAFATVVAYWFPVPHQVRSAWNATNGHKIHGPGVAGE